jgi:hypothetical protein
VHATQTPPPWDNLFISTRIRDHFRYLDTGRRIIKMDVKETKCGSQGVEE